MVTKLDPDAPSRQARSIHDLDQVCVRYHFSVNINI